jgi:hypothetical protein
MDSSAVDIDSSVQSDSVPSWKQPVMHGRKYVSEPEQRMASGLVMPDWKD